MKLKKVEKDIYKSKVLKKFPKAKCLKEENLPIFYVSIHGKRFASAFSEATAWKIALNSLDNKTIDKVAKVVHKISQDKHTTRGEQK
jgi:hypothetical protein